MIHDRVHSSQNAPSLRVIGVRVLGLAISLALTLSILLGMVRSWPHRASGQVWRLFLHLVSGEVNKLILATCLLWALGLAVFFGMRRVIPNRFLRAAVAVFAALVTPAIQVARWINREYLPGIWDPIALLANLFLVAAFAGLCLLIARGLQSRRGSRLQEVQAGRWRFLFVLIGIVVAIHIAARATPRPTAPNVLILLVDALRTDHLSCYGYPRNTSPNIDRLAADSVLFTQAVSPSTFTKTSIASLFTGFHPHRHGVFRASRRDRPGEITSDILASRYLTIAERLQQQGRLTAAWVENAQLRAFLGFDQGFNTYDDRAGGIFSIHRQLTAWLSRFAHLQPFFAYVHYLDLHDPYEPPAPFDAMYGTHSNVYERIGLDERGSWSEILRQINSGEIRLQPQDVDQLIAYYDGALTLIDRQIGRLLEWMQANELYDDSLIVLTSDHGDAFMEHGFLSHSTTPYEELVRVPLIVKFPQSRHAGRRIDRQVRLIDLAPTLLDALGIESRKEMDGISLLPLIAGDADAESAAPPPALIELSDRLAVRTEDWKLIYFWDDRWELYDLRADPGETRDLAFAAPEVSRGLLAIARMALARRDQSQTESIPLDKETIEALEALGYMD